MDRSHRKVIKMPSRPRNGTAPLTSNAYNDVIECWHKCMHGGVIVCASSGKAYNLRYRMYKYRTLLVEAHGSSAFDDMTIVIAPRDNRLFIRKRDAGILEIIPDTTITETEGGLIIATGPDIKEIPGAKPPIHEGRRPITPDDLISPSTGQSYQEILESLKKLT